jgi:glycosyltransferase involved in cell wall biosynthesis
LRQPKDESITPPSAPRLQDVEIAVDARYVRRRGMGIHRYVSDAIRLLVDEGASVTLLTNFPPDPFISLYSGVRWASFGSRHNIIWEQLQLPLFLRRGRYKLYWAPSNVGVPMLRVPRTWKVSTTHDLIPLRFARTYLWRDPRFALPFLVWTSAAIWRSDTLITVSQASAADIYHYFRRQASVVAPVLAARVRSSKRSELPDVLVGRRYVVYIGGRDPRKNVSNLLAGFRLAARQDAALHLVLLGDGFELFAQRVRDLGIADRVIMTGYVDDDTKDAILASAVALVYPSLYEGFGLPILEAFSCGVPVVTCRNSALGEVAGDAALYVDPRDPESIAEGIVTVGQQEVADRLRANGTARLALYAPEAARRQLVDALVDGVQALARRRPRKGARTLEHVIGKNPVGRSVSA